MDQDRIDWWLRYLAQEGVARVTTAEQGVRQGLVLEALEGARQLLPETDARFRTVGEGIAELQDLIAEFYLDEAGEDADDARIGRPALRRAVAAARALLEETFKRLAEEDAGTQQEETEEPEPPQRARSRGADNRC